ncbi:zinc-binding dehydrogenase [Streptomyces sp. ISL-10]|uniref:zinc-binding dehydrogenase n=1 Tax=Streptomyces sp. ISL-10 TaxID=2819172 RepID=UPI0035ABAC77
MTTVTRLAVRQVRRDAPARQRTLRAAPPFELGTALDGSAIGEVIASRAASVPVGATVSHFLGWREHAVLDATAATVVDTALAPASAYLGPLGTTGLTAYAALTRTAPVGEGDVVFVSAAAGAVGSVAGQLARQLGASRVIGSAGRPRKTKKLLDAFGFDAAVDYRQGGLTEQLSEAAPDGIDVYLDAVGGDHLHAAIGAILGSGISSFCGIEDASVHFVYDSLNAGEAALTSPDAALDALVT